MNVFSQMPGPQAPGGGADDVKSAIAMLMEQQQAGEPSPRPPTPEEAAQLKQAAMQVMQSKGQMPGQGSAGGAAFMGMGGMNPAIAQQQVPPSPSNAPPPPNEPSTPGPQIPPQLQGAFAPPSGGSTGYYPPSPKMAERGGKMATQTAEVAADALTPIGNALSSFAHADLDQPKKAQKKGPDSASQALDSILAQGGQGQEPPKPDNAPTPNDDGESATAQRPVAAPGSPAHTASIAKAAPEARQVSDAIVKSGADTPEKADIVLRSKFHDDPELERAIADAKATYDELRKVNNTPPTTGQYIGAILLGLLGANREVMQAVLHPNAHLNAQREAMSGEALLKLQLAKAQGKMHQNELEAKSGADSLGQKRLDEMSSRDEARDSMAQMKEVISYFENEANKALQDSEAEAKTHMSAAEKAVGKSKRDLLEKARVARQKGQDAANASRAKAAPFIKMLQDNIQKRANGLQQKNQPQQPAAQPGQAPPVGAVSMGSQPGQVSPSAARLIGMTA